MTPHQLNELVAITMGRPTAAIRGHVLQGLSGIAATHELDLSGRNEIKQSIFRTRRFV